MDRQPSAIAARVGAWLRTGDPAALWPGVTPASREEAHRRVTAVTSALLKRSTLPPRLEADRSVSATAWSAAAYLSGMGPLLGHWIQGGKVGADPRCTSVFAGHLDHGRRRTGTLGARLAALLDVLADKGVTPTLLKGSDTAYRYFPEPGTRPRADIDLLVAPQQLDTARGALAAAGYFEYRRTRHANRSEWRHEDAPQTLRSVELDHADNPWSLDLHVALERWYFRGLRAGYGYPTDDQLAPWTFDGRPVRVLAQPLLTAFLALHASYGLRDFRPLRAVELVLVLRRDTADGSLRWDALAELLDRTGSARFVYPAMELTERWIPGTLGPDLRRQLDRAATPRMRRVVNQVEADGLRLGHRSLDEKLMWARGATELLGNLSELVWSADDAMSAGDQLRVHLRRARMLVGQRVGVRAGGRGRRP
jgi:hypothetical protein